MSHVSCPRCQRANPADAVFCWFDGVVLRQDAAPPGSPSALPQEFVFPSGRRCRTYDELLAACQSDWEDARGLLRDGEFGRYLARLGRMDLVRAAKEAQAQEDPDLALQNFLCALPARQDHDAGPRLDLSPRRLMLGSMRVGEQRQVRVNVGNKGRGVLQGKIRVSEGEDWLKVAGADGEREAPIKTARDQDVTLRVEPHGLPAGQTYMGRLTVVTNGGVAEAPVRLDLAATPFAKAPFQGATSARELAEKMRADPKPAGPLLESGDVARWFAANGWSYPVAGTPARGVAAVQQFFECMGLSKPPPLELSQDAFEFRIDGAETARGQVTIRTPAKKWVYAQATSDQPWLRVTTPNASGPQQSTISFEVDPGRIGDGAVHDGVIQVGANAGQRFQVRVRVEVRRPAAARPRDSGRLAPQVVGDSLRESPTVKQDDFRFESPDDAPPRPRAPRPAGLVRAIVVGALLAFLLRLLLLAPADLYARAIAGAASGPAPTAGWDFWRLGPMTTAADERPSVIDPGFLRSFILATWWVGAAAGLVLVWRGGGRLTDVACGVVAGSAAGVVGAGTLACLTVLLDGAPRLLLGLMNAAAGPSVAALSPWAATPLWVLLAVVCWTGMGAAAGLALGVLGTRGQRILSAAAAPLTWLLRACGMAGASAFFALQ